MRQIRYSRAGEKTRTRRIIAQQLIGGSKLWYAYLASFLVLAMLGSVTTRVKPLAGNEKLWSLVFLITYSPWLYRFLTPRTWSNLKSATPLWLKRIGTVASIIIGITLIYYMAIFSGIPKILYYIDNSDGSVMTTITFKDDTVSLYTPCRPRIGISAEEWFSHVCVTQQFFDEVKVRDQIRVTGKISPYAIEPIHLELVY
jgi:hypothetical protein